MAATSVGLAVLHEAGMFPCPSCSRPRKYDVRSRLPLTIYVPRCGCGDAAYETGVDGKGEAWVLVPDSTGSTS
jgi:hypothetical protein